MILNRIEVEKSFFFNRIVYGGGKEVKAVKLKAPANGIAVLRFISYLLAQHPFQKGQVRMRH